MNHAQKYNDFMRAHKISRDSTLPKTNTRIGSTSADGEQVYGGIYSIPDSKYSDFLKLYYKHVIEGGASEHLTEKQRENDGPILIDIDFRYKYEVVARLHEKEHIDDIVVAYLDILKEVFDFDETPFYIYVMEKDTVNRIYNEEAPDASLTKDGIHILIGIQADHGVQMAIRDRILKKVAAMWGSLPLQNKWEDVFDKTISSGNTNWQLYGSRKPNHNPYKLTYVYENRFDPGDKEFMTRLVPLEKFDVSQNIENLSARSSKYPIYNTMLTSANISSSGGGLKKRVSTNSLFTLTNDAGVEAVLQVKTRDELALVVQATLDQMGVRDYELVETHYYTMTLPPKYYESGSYDKWIRVGMALSELCNLMFITWVAFSAQAAGFKFGDISEMYEKWQKFSSKGDVALTRRSIMYWSKQDAFAKFEEVRRQSVDYYIDKTIDSMMDDFGDKNKKFSKPCGDFQIANVLKQLYKDEYVCVSIKHNIWYKFHNHRWVEIDSGTTLRKAISTELYDIYMDKISKLSAFANTLDEDDESMAETRKKVTKKTEKICDICLRLMSTGDKKNIMTEAKELFHDSQFMEKLDTNPYLLCFENGVVDFKDKVFRKGLPEDYISKSTNLDYKPIDRKKDATVIAEIDDFMAKLFPRPDLREYMWDHLASVLLGTPDKQTFHMYIGEGRNGKSVLTTLIDEIMGEYKGVVPLSVITQDRAKVGGTAAELAELKGVRYAVIMEPSKKDAILEGPLKQMTSGLDPIQCRAPYMAKTLIYYPQFKLVLCSNVMMEVKSQDYGTWRRIRVVPFESLFTETPVQGDPDKPFQFLVDGSIVDKFSYWKFTFMSMLVERAYKTNGMVKECDIVMSASRAYQESQDFIAEFIREKVVREEGAEIKKTVLNNEFSVWYMSTYGKGAPSPKEVHVKMDQQFGKYDKKGAWTGVRIKYERDEYSAKRDAEVFDDGISANDL
uniref:SF3 helicase domain-containing protein n=1 Tax=viral metagenome TaxID=1070528 RepID=A0A6C0B662_9ZZZZ